MGRVVMKHTEIEKRQRKKARNDKEDKLMGLEKRNEKVAMSKFKLKELDGIKQDRDERLKEKFQSMDKSHHNVNRSLCDFKKILREQHMFR